MTIFIGCAGWSVNNGTVGDFAGEGTHLERYARRFNAVEINSSFYRPHQSKTYLRWAASTPEDFRFAVKLPKSITHDAKLVDSEPLLNRFLNEVAGLAGKMGPLLMQLPPSLRFDKQIVDSFLRQLRGVFDSTVVCEPRHRTWFTPAANALLADYRIARVAADPPVGVTGLEPGGWGGVQYFRLHGSPRMYYSSYAPDFLERLAVRLCELRRQSIEAWYIFDNTAAGAAITNCLQLQKLTSAVSSGADL